MVIGLRAHVRSISNSAQARRTWTREAGHPMERPFQTRRGLPDKAEQISLAGLGLQACSHVSRCALHMPHMPLTIPRHLSLPRSSVERGAIAISSVVQHHRLIQPPCANWRLSVLPTSSTLGVIRARRGERARRGLAGRTRLGERGARCESVDAQMAVPSLPA